MGDRGIVVMRKGEDYSPGVYVHWSGGKLLAYLQEAAPSMRQGDPLYAAARFCGIVHGKIPGCLPLGLLDAPSAEDVAEGFTRYSQGDAGVVVLDVGSGEVRCYAGYLTEEPSIAPLQLAKA